MAKTKTVHTPDSKAHSITFAGAQIAEFGRVDPASGWIKFRCSLGGGLDALFGRMGWDVPGEKTAMEKLDGKLSGGNFILTAKDKLIEAEVDVAYVTVTDFACHRFEIEGRKKKGFRRELRFSVSFTEDDACAKLENYMMTSDNARGSLKVVYYPEQVQEDLDLSSDEARQAVLEGTADESGTLASARQMGSKRSRLAEAN